MKNDLPNWLNVIFIAVILIFACWGAMIFMNPDFVYNKADGIHNYKPFFASGIFTGIYLLLLFATSVMTNYELSTVIFLLLLTTGLLLLWKGFSSKDHADKTTAFEIAAAILGLALGIPFGDKLRASHKKPIKTAKTTTHE